MGAEDRSGPDSLHASCVAIDGRGALITGRSGAGKSALALGLLARGARLVSDDRTTIERQDGAVIAICPDPIAGLIEARGVGLLRARQAGPTPLALVVDLDRIETDRLPPQRSTRLLGVTLALVYKVESSHFIDAVLLYLESGRSR